MFCNCSHFGFLNHLNNNYSKSNGLCPARGCLKIIIVHQKSLLCRIGLKKSRKDFIMNLKKSKFKLWNLALHGTFQSFSKKLQTLYIKVSKQSIKRKIMLQNLMQNKNSVYQYIVPSKYVKFSEIGSK